MIGAKFGHFLDRPLSRLTARINVSPNTLTVAGFVITSLAALVLAVHLLAGGILILLGGVFDMLDGIVARNNRKTTEFGAFLDSVLDRYADSFLFLGLAWYLAAAGDHTGAFLSIGTMLGAYLVSYTRARAEGLGRQCKSGIMERPERIVLLAFGAISGWITPVLWAMFVLTHFTALQRVYLVWKAMRE
ncbi:MAG: CDP-alcohol phosphatidyltransferase family protein [Thermodesulfovibrionales bacterium]